MNYEIRAMSFAEILDTGFRLVRDHFALLAGIGLVLYAPLAVVQELIARPQTPGQVDAATALTAVGFGLLVIVLSPIAGGAMTVAIGNAYRGQSIGFADAYRASLRRALALTGTALLAGLGVLVGLVLFVIPGIYLMVAWMLLTPIVMLEEVAGTSALSRSRYLLQHHMLRALGIIIVGAIIVLVLSTVLPFLVSGIPIVRSVAEAIAQSVGYAFSTGVGVVLYFDLRCRKENFDLEHLAQLVEGAAAPAHPTPAHPTA